MVKFRIMCPDCGSAVLTASPDAVVWEVCPGCRRHVWDVEDALMADVCTPEPADPCGGNARARN